MPSFKFGQCFMIPILAYPFCLIGGLLVAIPHTFVLAWRLSKQFITRQRKP